MQEKFALCTTGNTASVHGLYGLLVIGQTVLADDNLAPFGGLEGDGDR